jgi:serine/threonine protein kinase
MSNLPCEPDQWPTFSRLLYAALDLPLDERAAWLDSLAPELAYFRPGLAKVLECAELPDASQFLTRPIIAVVEDSEFAAAQRIGPYTLERELGRGGMSEVWLATRSDGTLTRQVALKLPYAHLLAGPQRQRFGRERDILAALSHPHVAVLYDAGVSDGGHPYLAMEWIDGIPITRYCEDMQLSIRARLTLFRQVLEAVHYAHVNLVAHRDLKPSNILVTRRGEVKLLDFGIAKLLSGSSDGSATEMTRLGGRAATPDYAAPEQIRGEPITTAVDVYASGVLLFEILTGVRPFDAARSGAEDRGPFPLASRRVGGESARAVGGLSAAQLRKALHGDLDAVVAKALERDPTNRYRSAEAFADDLTHYQCHEPVSARRIGRLLQLTKFVQRNRAASALAATLLLALIGGSAGIAWEALRAEREAARAETEKRGAENEAKREKATKDFLTSIFTASDPRIASDQPRGSVSAQDLLHVASGRIEKEFSADPDTEIELMRLVTGIFDATDDLDAYRSLHTRYIDLVGKRYGELHPLYIEGLVEEADSKIGGGEQSAAAQLLDRADGLIRRAGLDHSRERALWWDVRAALLRGQAVSSEERVAALQAAIRLFADIAPTDILYARDLSALGGIRYRADDDKAAELLIRQAIDVVTRRFGPEYGELAPLFVNLGSAASEDGDFDAATRAYEQAAAVALKTYGPNSREYEGANTEHALLLHQRGQRARALELFKALYQSTPAQHRYATTETAQIVAVVRDNYGSCLLAEGRAAAAIPLLEEAIRIFSAMSLYSDDKQSFRLHVLLGDAYAMVGRQTDARRELNSTLTALSHAKPADDLLLLRARERWGHFLEQRGDARGAEREYREVLMQAHGRNIAPVVRAYGGLAQLALARRDVVQSLELSELATATADQARTEPDVRLGPPLWRIRAEALLLSGDATGAMTWAQKALDAERRFDDPSSPDIAAAEATLRAATQFAAFHHS